MNNNEQDAMLELINKIIKYIQSNKITFHEFTEYYQLVVGLKNNNLIEWKNLLNNLLNASVLLMSDDEAKLLEEYKNNLQSSLNASNKR